MQTSKKRSLAFDSGSPKSPRMLQDPKSDSTAADRCSPPTYGPHNRAASTQAQHPPQSPSFTYPRTPQLQFGSIRLAVAAAPRRASPSPNSPRVPPQPAVPGPDPAATPSGPHRRAVRATSRPPPPTSGITTVSATADWCTPPSPQAGPLSISTPSPACVRTPSPSRGSRSSSASSLAGQSQMSGDSSDRSKRSYAAVVKCPAKPNKCQNHDIILSGRLFNYLLKCTINSETTVTHIHKEPIITMRKTESSDLKIVEEHLDEHDPELAYHLFISQDRFKEWLYPTVSQFLISKGIANNAVGGMNATFYTMPPSTKTLEDFLREQGSLVSMKSIFDGNFELCVASDIGMMLAHGFLVYVLNIHKQGRSWNGGFSTGDMVVENCFKCRITKISTQGKSHCRAADLHKIAEIFKSMFTNNEGMALYFDVLQKDLHEASNVEVEVKWYREYIVSHPALKSSIARYNLECALHHAATSFRSKDGLVRSILRKHNRWKELIPHETTEGTPDTVLYGVFYHKHDLTEGLDPYASTVGALLSYKRNLLQHGHEYIKVQDHTELEQFAARTFSQALPNIVRELLSHHKMNGPFKDHWEAYCSSRVGNDGNTEGRISLKEHIHGRAGISISFCEDGRCPSSGQVSFIRMRTSVACLGCVRSSGA
ncbi:uncharacterized protein [Miscanthus floridulus]|uniref:uncharacterized protein isoform X2 n=1 Tax=Miscanthus floridulus TaxID=154761 RepID=UPI00345788C0